MEIEIKSKMRPYSLGFFGWSGKAGEPSIWMYELLFTRPASTELVSFLKLEISSARQGKSSEQTELCDEEITTWKVSDRWKYSKIPLLGLERKESALLSVVFCFVSFWTNAFSIGYLIGLTTRAELIYSTFLSIQLFTRRPRVKIARNQGRLNSCLSEVIKAVY